MQLVGAEAHHAQADALVGDTSAYSYVLSFFYVPIWQLNANIIQPMVTTGFGVGES